MARRAPQRRPDSVDFFYLRCVRPGAFPVVPSGGPIAARELLGSASATITRSIRVDRVIRQFGATSCFSLSLRSVGFARTSVRWRDPSYTAPRGMRISERRSNESDNPRARRRASTR